MTKESLVRLLALNHEIKDILKTELEKLPLQDRVSYLVESGSKIMRIKVLRDHSKNKLSVQEAHEKIKAVWNEPNRQECIHKLFGFN